MELLELNPNPMLILSGGEPLLRRGPRRDCGTRFFGRCDRCGWNQRDSPHGSRSDQISGQRCGVELASRLASTRCAPSIMTGFVMVHGRSTRTRSPPSTGFAEHELDFVVQTSLTRGNRHELGELVRSPGLPKQGAVSFNLYFLVPTGARQKAWQGLSPGRKRRGASASWCSLETAVSRDRMMIRSKCQPQIMRHVAWREIPSLRS